ncbi:MAG TPA: hypothetical protein VHL53_10755 [Acidimicrobiia bacterium]|nr:hypothetical protein [Acidimicrobiia bacterium]
MAPLGDAPERKKRPKEQAVPLPEPPETTFSADLRTLCHHGERAVTVAGGRDRELVAVLGSPFDPEAFVTWRTDGIQVFFRGEAPARLDLQLSAGAYVTATAFYNG